jgi:hypothetical protein
MMLLVAGVIALASNGVVTLGYKRVLPVAPRPASALERDANRAVTLARRDISAAAVSFESLIAVGLYTEARLAERQVREKPMLGGVRSCILGACRTMLDADEAATTTDEHGLVSGTVVASIASGCRTIHQNRRPAPPPTAVSRIR